MITAIWKGRIEFSPLTEFAFYREQSLIEDLISTIGITVGPEEGGHDLGRNPEDGKFSRSSKQAEGSWVSVVESYHAV